MIHARGVVFDLDGVLVESEEVNIRSAFEAFAAAGCPLRDEDRERIVGRHPGDYAGELADLRGLPAQALAGVRRHQGRLYHALWSELARESTGATAVLEALARRGFSLGLATSAGRAHVERCFERFGWHGRFASVVTFDDVRCRKPDPEPYGRATVGLGLEPRDVVAVEDSEHGRSSAERAGLRCVVVRTANTSAETIGAGVASISGVSELPALLSR